MVVDVSHCSDKSFWQIMDVVEGPIVASHSNCRALCSIGRNLTDDQLGAIAHKGGVVGVHFASGFISKEYHDQLVQTGFYEQLCEWDAELRRSFPDPYEYLARRFDLESWPSTPLARLQESIPPPPLSAFVDHIDHIVNTAGIDHVGLGTDYDLGSIPVEVCTADRLPALTAALAVRGYRGESITKILSQNFLRVFGRLF